MGTAESDFEQLFEEKKRVRNPLVPVGALMTAGVLTAGLISFRRGNSQMGQVLMRARVVVQGATVALMGALVSDISFSFCMLILFNKINQCLYILIAGGSPPR
ncbi:HYPOXIA-INDUCBILE protein 1 HIG1 -RELATED [Salix viminalis]|uniref:HYPOXIA-INDUCBILE protein 1 HIG1 -RELATED n=1 Tax=Salix viminalis TaxID=40686 RepID=A0A9Q0NME3_SALVM|nr:HYPOXIA-INDUCBILE protein 1 HIG1 -RELATED [Salix viminalis]